MVTKEDQVKFYAEELKELEFSVKKLGMQPGYPYFKTEMYMSGNTVV